MSHEPANADSALEEQLVAYLDGEVDAETGRRVEEALATDPQLRRKLQGLDRTWELLGELDTPQVAQRFTQSTLEMVTVAAEEDVQRSRDEAPRRRRKRWTIVAVSLLAAGLAGFLSAALFVPDPDRQLIRDLPVLVRFDQYGQTEGVEFLRMLHGRGLFAGESRPVYVGESPAERRRWVGGMSPAEKDQLRQLQKRFAKLKESKPDECQRIERLHQQIEADADAGDLLRVMYGYTEWLKALPPYVRAEVVELEDPEKRIERIEELLDEQKQRASRAKDVEGLLRWMERYATRNEARLLATLPQPDQERIAELSPAMRRRLVKGMMWRQWQTFRPGHVPSFGEDDLKELRSELSDETRQQLQTEPVGEQWRTIAGLVRHAVRHNLGLRGLRGPLPADHEKRLDEFFQQLPKQEQDRLLSLPGDQMQEELRRMYLMQWRSPEPWIRRPGPPPPDWRPGRPRREGMPPAPPRKGPRPDVPPAVPTPRTPPEHR